MIVAEKCLALMLQRFRRECLALNGERPLTAELDDLALGSLLLVGEHFEKLKRRRILEEIENCVWALEYQPPGREAHSSLSELLYYDQMPFTIASELIRKQRLPQRNGVERLKKAVSHHDSGVRWYFYRICWMLKRHLPKEKLLDPLFKNIGESLGYVEQAAGLAYGLCDDGEEFFARSEKFTPEPAFLAQYQERIKIIKENRLVVFECLRPFESLELRLRKQIADVALNLELAERLDQALLSPEFADEDETHEGRDERRQPGSPITGD